MQHIGIRDDKVTGLANALPGPGWSIAIKRVDSESRSHAFIETVDCCLLVLAQRLRWIQK